MYLDIELYNSVMFRYLNPREGTETSFASSKVSKPPAVQIP